MISKKLFLSFAFFVALTAIAQTKSKDVLFTINDKPYYTDEFSRVYKKNLDLVKDESQKDLDAYLELFIGYKLKVNKAYALNLQDGETYQSELKSYRTQLAKNYFNDTKITQELIEEGYNRLQKEVRASHILITVDENAAPADTLIAYNKIKELRNRILKGENFDDIAVAFSQDPSAKDNKGDLGYFSAFRMVYPFENAAYTTSKGQVSTIFRTRFGFHILKVNEIRPNRGEVTVAHIMILNPKGEDEQSNPEDKINDIYKKISQGEKFEELAKQFSEDKSSSAKGGLMNKFSSGQLSSEEFESVAFSLVSSNDISKPFRSQFGWHIVKLIEKHPVRTLDEMKNELEDKIGKDERSKKIVVSLNEKLQKKYKYKKETKQVAAALKTITDDIYAGAWQIPSTGIDLKATILTIQDKKIETITFFEFVEMQQRGLPPIKPVAKLATDLFEKFTNTQLNGYYDENLENEFPEFSYVMEEYRDGLLLFDLMEKEIWNRSKTDTIGLEKFYETQKNNHMWKKRIEATIFSSTKKDMIEKALALLKKGSSPKEIKEKLNTNEVVNVMINANTFEEGNETLPKGTKFEVGVSPVIKDGEYYFAIQVAKVLPAGVKSLEECRGKLTNEYQQYLEQHWVDDLKKEFTVKVNQEVFEKAKADLKK